jgi:competence protein ComEC
MKFPTLNITLCVVLGILASNEVKPGINSACLLVSILFIPYLLLFWFSNKKATFRFYFGLSTYLLSFFVGFMVYTLHSKPNQQHHYSNNLKYEKALVSGVISEKIRPNQYVYKYFLEIETVDNIDKTGKLLIVLSKKDAKKEFQIGDVVLAYAYLKPISRPHNPYQFDYAAYLEKKDVYHQLNLERNNYRVIGHEKHLNYKLEQIRNTIITKLENAKIPLDRLEIIKALFLGQRQNIDQETNNQYSQAGAIHILAISGLHIGILLFFFKTLLKPLERFRYGKIILPFLLIFILWSFALLSGLSASVVRAVTMFSFITIGMYMRRETNIYNTLGSSILLILLIRPNFLFDVGFQLSYCAVFSIVTIQPIFAKLWKSGNKIIQYFYDILTVSFAAQIGVLPLSLYYFHQFPGLFFLTNLVVIPLLTLILVCGMIALLFAVMRIPTEIFIHLLSFLVGLMNRYVAFISSLEKFIIKGIPFNLTLLFSSLLALIGIVLWFKKPKFNRILIALICILLFQLSIIGSLEYHKSNDEFIIFQYPKQTILAKKTNNSLTIFSNEKDIEDNYVLKNYLQANFGQIGSVTKLKNILQINDTKILVIDKEGIYRIPIKPNIILLTQSPKINLERVIEELNPAIIIADGSNYKYLLENWQHTCLQKNIPFHSTSEKGYYKIELN